MTYDVWAHYASTEDSELKGTFYTLSEAMYWIRAQEIISGGMVHYEIKQES